MRLSGLILDGEEYIFNKPDKAKKVMSVNHQDQGTTDIVEQTELGQALKELNDDSIESDSRMSGIDMRARLSGADVSSILVVDTLVGFNFLPQDCLAFTRQRKRLSVSVNGEGRKEITTIVAGQREHQVGKAGGGIMDKAKSILGLNPKPEVK